MLHGILRLAAREKKIFDGKKARLSRSSSGIVITDSDSSLFYSVPLFPFPSHFFFLTFCKQLSKRGAKSTVVYATVPVELCNSGIVITDSAEFSSNKQCVVRVLLKKNLIDAETTV